MDVMRAGENQDGTLLERECIECGFVDYISTGVNNPNELTTRVNEKASSVNQATPVQIVKIIE
jgi:Zn ribbon nucleic-acid-binding protein